MPYEIIQLPNKKYSVINIITKHQFSKGTTKAKAKSQMRLLYMKAREMDGAGATGKMEGGSDGGIYDSMSDADLHKYFPNAKIVKYSELPRETPVEEWLKVGEVVFLLYEHELNSGHWVCIARGPKAVFYFDSYGNAPDVPLKWTDEETREELGENEKVLTRMFQMSKVPVYYNDYPYQSTKEGISTCGRWCSAFLTHFKKYKGDLKSFKKETLKRANGKPLDQFIANIYDE